MEDYSNYGKDKDIIDTLVFAINVSIKGINRAILMEKDITNRKYCPLLYHEHCLQLDNICTSISNEQCVMCGEKYINDELEIINTFIETINILKEKVNI